MSGKQNPLTGCIRKVCRALIFIPYLLIAACASGPGEKQGPVFYPPLPNSPRLQHLHSLSSLKDLGEGSAFAEFILGKDLNESLVKKPYGLASSRGKLFVVDTRGPGYVVIDLEKNKHWLVTGGGAGRMRKPINITIDVNGDRYVTDTARNQVLVFNHLDRFVRAYGVKGQFKPGDVKIIGNRLYVSDLKNHLIQVLDKRSGKLLFKIAEKKKSVKKKSDKKKPDYIEQDLYFPTNMALNTKELLVSDTGYFKINRYSLDGKFLTSFGKVGSQLGNFARPKGIDIDKDGNLYVVDAAYENVQVFDKTGTLLLFFGGPGGYPENINLPTDVLVDYHNVGYFQKYAEPGFKIDYLVIVASQFGVNKLNIFGFGKMEGMKY